MFDKKWILYDNQQWPAQWLDWEVPNHFPKPNLHQKMLWSLFDVLLSVRYTTAFWIPEKPFHLRSMLSKSITCTESCDTCSSLLTERTRFFFMTMPDRMSHNTYFKSWTNLASFAIFTWLLANQLPLLQASWQLFAGKRLPQPAGGRKHFPRVIQILKHRFLPYRNKQTYFLLTKMCWL